MLSSLRGPSLHHYPISRGELLCEREKKMREIEKRAKERGTQKEERYGTERAKEKEGRKKGG